MNGKLDRRIIGRIQETASVEIRFNDPVLGKFHKLTGFLTGLSEQGVSFFLEGSNILPEIIELQIENIDGNSSINLTCKSCWVRNLPISNKNEYGVRILNITPSHEIMLHKHISKKLIEKRAIRDRRSNGEIESVPFTIKNLSGNTISCYMERIKSEKNNLEKTFIIIPPDFGQTKIGLIELSYLLAKNGFNVIRFDLTNHVGESDGEIRTFTPDSFIQDIKAVLKYVQGQSYLSNIGIISYGMTGRFCFTLASTDDRIKFLISVMPTVEIESTLEKVYMENVYEKYSGNHNGHEEIDLFGFPVVGNIFFPSIKALDYASLNSTITDVEKIKIPFAMIISDHSVWTSMESFEVCFKRVGSSEKKMVSLHRLRERYDMNDMEVKRKLFDEIIDWLSVFRPAELMHLPINKVSTREISAQSMFEYSRSRSHFLSKNNTATNIDFWEKYLESLKFAVKFPQFKEYYQRISELMGEIGKGEYILDAGCGNGSFGAWTLLSNKNKNFTYVGADFVLDALAMARKSCETITRDLFVENEISPIFSFHIMDLNKPIPYIDNTFNKICCNLVLPYVANPLFSLKELYRVLKSRGSLVFTVISPNPDFSSIYRDFVKNCGSADERESAKKLLNNISWLVEKEKQGQFKFFADQEINNLFSEFEFEELVIENSLDDQARIVLIRKA